MPQPLASLKGRYENFKVLNNGFRDHFNHRTSKCLCDCGKVFYAIDSMIHTGRTRSCGCKRAFHISKAKTVHGHVGKRIGTKREGVSPTYGSWSSMKRRCSSRKNYIQRGIKVCERWYSFNNFLKDMGECPKGKTLDRVNNDKGYFKGNCRWATIDQQANNTSTNVRLLYKGVSLTVTQWAKNKKIDQHTLFSRINAGWSVENALNKPDNYKRRPRSFKRDLVSS